MPDDNPGQPIQNDGQIGSPPPLVAEQQPRTGGTAQVGQGDVSTEIKSLEDRVKKGEWWMIGLTGAITLFALCSVVVGILQWDAMRGQLKEMHEGGVDTRESLNLQRQIVTVLYGLETMRVELISVFHEGTNITAGIQVRNFGKEATDISVSATMDFRKESPAVIISDFKNFESPDRTQLGPFRQQPPPGIRYGYYR